CPLSGAADDVWFLLVRILRCFDRYIEIIEDAKQLVHRLFASTGRTSRLRECDRANESRRGSEVTGEPDHPAAGANWLEVQIGDFLVGKCDRREIDVVPQIRFMPIVTR